MPLVNKCLIQEPEKETVISLLNNLQDQVNNAKDLISVEGGEEIEFLERGNGFMVNKYPTDEKTLVLKIRLRKGTKG